MVLFMLSVPMLDPVLDNIPLAELTLVPTPMEPRLEWVPFRILSFEVAESVDGPVNATEIHQWNLIIDADGDGSARNLWRITTGGSTTAVLRQRELVVAVWWNKLSVYWSDILGRP